MWWLVLSGLPLVRSFTGQEYWKDLLPYCGKTANGLADKDPDLLCHLVHDKLHFFKVEILSTKPIILRYHQIIHRRLVKRVLGEVKQLKLERAGVISTDPQKPIQYLENRVANGSWIPHREQTHFNHMFNTLQRSILALDLSKAEAFQVLSYNKDGHYAPHWDFLMDAVTTTVPIEGNRITTVFTVLQPSKKGGTTTFPYVGVNVRLNAGDALVWQNMNVDGKYDDRSLHAACPVLDGTKIGATLWVRAFGQEFRMPCLKEKKWGLDVFLKPSAKWADRPLFCKPPGPG